MTPSLLMDAWLAARSRGAMRAILSTDELQVPRASWSAFWSVYAPAARADRRSSATRFAAEQLGAAEAALETALTDSPQLQIAVARTYTRAYWIEVYGRVERQAVARRQARYLTMLTAPGWTADPGWRTSDVRTLVATAIRTADFSVMPILADALQDAGCDNGEWLGLMRDESQPWFAGAGVLATLR